ncbi:MAG: hypothetical protein HOK60_01495 [Planctomycetes bacterium]|nr:hypothetical protein [Planctomycetota bacterium]
MNLQDRERELLISRPSWRQPALPARRGALLRATLVTVLLWTLFYPVVPAGPEMMGSCQVLVEASPFDGGASPALSACRTLHRTVLGWIPPMMAASCLSILLMGLSCGAALCWLRQQDAARGVLIPLTLALGLSQGITELTRIGGATPLAICLGMILIATTEQMRAEAGRGLWLWGILLGLSIAAGPSTAPALIYSLLSLLSDRGIRASHLRSLPAASIGILLGISLLFLLASASAGNGLTEVWTEFVSSWRPVQHPDYSHLGADLRSVLEGNGWLLAMLAIPGLLISCQRRPGDLALILTLASSGPLLGPLFADGSSGPTPSIPDSIAAAPFIRMTLTLLAAWSLTMAYRRLGKHRRTTHLLLMTILWILVGASLSMRTPDLRSGKTQVVTQWARSVLEGLPEDSLLLCGGSPLGSVLSVVQSHEGIRPDVTVLDRSGAIDPILLGLPVETPAPRVLQVARSLIASGRPLLALPLALHQELLRGHGLSPWGLLLIARDRTDPAPDDSGAWQQVKIADLPLESTGAWQWIRGEGDHPHASGRLASEVAAAAWFATARRNGNLRDGGRWAGILGLLGDLIKDPGGTRRWALQQPVDLFGESPRDTGGPVSDPRSVGSPDRESDALQD